MANPRFTGALLLIIGIFSFFGTTTGTLPPAAFWAGLLVYPIGGYLFFIGSRAAALEANAPVERSVSPRIRTRPPSPDSTGWGSGETSEPRT